MILGVKVINSCWNNDTTNHTYIYIQLLIIEYTLT